MRSSTLIQFALATVGGTGSVIAQEVLSPGPLYPVTPPALRDIEAQHAGFIPSVETSATGTPQSDNPLRWTVFDFHPHALYRFTYGDGVQSSPGNKHTTAINEIQPGFLLDIGQHWSLDYTPTVKWYSNKAFKDSTDHAVRLSGGAISGDWTFNGSQSYVSSSSPLIETGSQTDQESFATLLGASRRIGTDFSDELTLNQNFTSCEQFASSKQWALNNWFNYQITPQLTLGCGIGAGFVNMDMGPDSLYEQYQGRISWRVAEKLTMEFNTGLEDRQFCTGGTGDLLNPIYGASIVYAPFEHTRLSVTGDRTISQSYFQNQVNESTSIQASLNQRLLGRLYLNLGGGLRYSDYVASTTGAFLERNDDNYFYNVHLSHPVLKRGNIAIFYRHTENTSNRSSYAFTSDQIGFEFGYKF